MPAPFLSSVTVQPDGRTVLYVYTAAVTLVGAPNRITGQSDRRAQMLARRH